MTSFRKVEQRFLFGIEEFYLTKYFLLPKNWMHAVLSRVKQDCEFWLFGKRSLLDQLVGSKPLNTLGQFLNTD
jgi:hypothetical protein